jgi:hypothetical protein
MTTPCVLSRSLFLFFLFPWYRTSPPRWGINPRMQTEKDGHDQKLLFFISRGIFLLSHELIHHHLIVANSDGGSRCLGWRCGGSIRMARRKMGGRQKMARPEIRRHQAGGGQPRRIAHGVMGERGREGGGKWLGRVRVSTHGAARSGTTRVCTHVSAVVVHVCTRMHPSTHAQ